MRLKKTPNMDIWLRVGISHQVSAKFIEALKQACFPGSPALAEEITQKTMHFKRRQIDRKIIPQISTEKKTIGCPAFPPLTVHPSKQEKQNAVFGRPEFFV